VQQAAADPIEIRQCLPDGLRHSLLEGSRSARVRSANQHCEGASPDRREHAIPRFQPGLIVTHCPNFLGWICSARLIRSLRGLPTHFALARDRRSAQISWLMKKPSLAQLRRRFSLGTLHLARHTIFWPARLVTQPVPLEAGSSDFEDRNISWVRQPGSGIGVATRCRFAGRHRAFARAVRFGLVHPRTFPEYGDLCRFLNCLWFPPAAGGSSRNERRIVRHRG